MNQLSPYEMRRESRRRKAVARQPINAPLLESLMPYLIVLALLLFSLSARSQAFLSGSVGKLNNVAISMRAGYYVHNFKFEIGASFSQVVPFQHHITAGYKFFFAEKWAVTPAAGIAQYHYGSDKELNRISAIAGIEISRSLDVQLLQGADIFADYTGRFIGAGLRIIL